VLHHHRSCAAPPQIKCYTITTYQCCTTTDQVLHHHRSSAAPPQIKCCTTTNQFCTTTDQVLHHHRSCAAPPEIMCCTNAYLVLTTTDQCCTSFLKSRSTRSRSTASPPSPPSRLFTDHQTCRVGQNPIYIQCVYGIFDREVTKYTITYGTYDWFMRTQHFKSYKMDPL